MEPEGNALTPKPGAKLLGFFKVYSIRMNSLGFRALGLGLGFNHHMFLVCSTPKPWTPKFADKP